MNTATDFLEGMIERRRADISAQWDSLTPADLERLVCCARPTRDFTAALATAGSVAVIAEIKKASPSAGLIAPDIEASKQALHYQAGGAAAISVLTEPTAFGGSFTDLSDVADAVDVPVLCKDFVVDPLQLAVARGHGADAVLLMVSVLGADVGRYLDEASTFGLQCLVEVTSAGELDIARKAGATLVAVNARDLRTLTVDTAAAAPLVAAAKAAGMTVVHASGIRSRGDVKGAAAAGADAVLVGEALMREPFPEDVLAVLTGVPKAPTARSTTGSSGRSGK